MKSTFWSTLALASAITFAGFCLRADEQPDLPGGSAPKARRSGAPKTSGVKPVSTSDTPLAAIPISPGPAVAREQNVNVRGQAAINSEVVTRLKRGDKVTVLEEVTVKGEPSKWAKIAIPAGVHVWVHGSFIDPTDKTVKPNKLKLRGGPGENYSVLGIIPKGTAVKEIETKGEWMKIEPPDGAHAFVASHLLAPDTGGGAVVASAQTPTPAASGIPATPAPALENPPTVVTSSPPATPAPTPTPAPEPVITAPPQTVPPQENVASPQNLVNTPAPTPDPSTPAGTPVTTPEPAPADPPQAEEELIKRVVTREGIVKRSVSIQAPSYFALQSIDTGKTINYLYSEGTNVVLKDFSGQRVVLSGEERLDERWPNTPVIYIETLQPVP